MDSQASPSVPATVAAREPLMDSQASPSALASASG
jgi:hypothetical protein